MDEEGARAGEIVLDREEMEAASIAVMEANFEAQIGMTVEERIAELEENRGIRFYSFIG